MKKERSIKPLGSDRDANNGPISFGYMLFGFISKNNE
jgi:hypothetical protein